jgi:hypothetical protein
MIHKAIGFDRRRPEIDFDALDLPGTGPSRLESRARLTSAEPATANNPAAQSPCEISPPPATTADHLTAIDSGCSEPDAYIDTTASVCRTMKLTSTSRGRHHGTVQRQKESRERRSIAPDVPLEAPTP